MGLAVGTFVAFRFDLPVARAMRGDHSVVPGDVNKAINLMEAFGHLAGALVILLGVWTLDPPGRRRLVIPLGMILASGLCVQLLKRLVSRTRPSAITDWGMTVGDTFGGWHGLSGLLDSRFQSFPSAHAAVATALAWSLASLYPRGRYYFATLAVLASLQRVTASAHFPSDVLAGAAISSLVAALWPRRSEATG